MEICLLHQTRKCFIFNYRVQLTIAKPTGDVEVRGTDARPMSVCDGSFRMQHRAVPLENTNTSFEQWAIPGSRQRSQERNVSSIGEEQSHVNAIACRRSQSLYVHGRSRIVGISQP